MMKPRVAALFMGLMLVMGPLASAPQAGAERMGLCPVCQATGGETEEEPIKATRTYEGKEYGFCSEKCAKTFDAEPAAYIPPSFPRQAPSFALKDLKGTALSNEKLKGKVVLLDFWATWCAPCKKSMPELQALHAKYADRGFTVLGISIDEGDVAKVKRFVDSKKVTYPVAMDREESPAWEAFNVKAIPAAFLIDQKGRIVAQWTGAPAGTQDVEMELNKLLALD